MGIIGRHSADWPGSFQASLFVFTQIFVDRSPNSLVDQIIDQLAMDFQFHGISIETFVTLLNILVQYMVYQMK